MHLAVAGRRCPCCGCDGLIGHGPRPRTYRVEPVSRSKPAPQTFAYRVICKSCRHSHTVLPAALGPHKRYVVGVIEFAVRGIEAGMLKGRISADLFGVSPERITAWWRHISQRVFAVRRAAETIVVRDPLFQPPAALPSAGMFAYLQSLLGVESAVAILVALNALLSVNLPLTESLLIYPPTSSGGRRPPCPMAQAGGMPFG
ncbi:MAG: DUF6431 domain-containing protein [Gammaproteobacteria bacterium]